MFKDILKGTGIYSITVVAERVASFLLLPVYTRFLMPADYGLLELLDLTVYILTALVGMRIAESLYYYHSRADDPESQKRVVCTVLLGAVAMGAIGSALASLAAPWISQGVFGTRRYVPLFYLLYTTFAFSLPLQVGLAYVRTIDRPKLYVAISVGRLILTAALNVVFLAVYGMGAPSILWSSLVVTSLTTPLLLLYVLKGIRPRQHFEWALLKDFLRYSSPLGLGSLSLFVINFGDRFFLRTVVSLADLGIYALAYKMGMLVVNVQTPFDTYWKAQMFRIVRQPRGEAVYVGVSTYVTLGLTYIVLLLALFTKPVIHLLVAPAFYPAAIFVPWIAAAYVLRSLGVYFSSAFLLEGKTVQHTCVTAASAAACLAAYAALIPRFQLWGAVAGTLVGFGVMVVLALWQAQKLRPFPYEFRRLAHLAVLAALVAAIFTAIQPASLWAHCGLAVVVAGAYPLLLLRTKFFRADELLFAEQLLTALKRRISYAGWRAGEGISG